MAEKNFKNKKAKRKNLSQIFRYFRNNYGPVHEVKLEKDENEIPEIIKEEGLEEEYLENNDLL